MTVSKKNTHSEDGRDGGKKCQQNTHSKDGKVGRILRKKCQTNKNSERIKESSNSSNALVSTSEWKP